MSLKISELSYHREKKHIIKNISLEFPKQQIVGMLGPNGAGKTTMMQIFSGYIKESSGEVSIGGRVDRNEQISRTVYLSNKLFFPEYWTAKRVIKVFGASRKRFNHERFIAFVAQLKLDLGKQLREMTRGEKERLFLALALSQEADYYFLDEPLTGIDLLTREELLKGLLVFANPDATIVIASHYIETFETLFEKVFFLKDGALLDVIDPDEMREKEQMSLTDYYRKLYHGGDNLQ